MKDPCFGVAAHVVHGGGTGAAPGEVRMEALGGCVSIVNTLREQAHFVPPQRAAPEGDVRQRAGQRPCRVGSRPKVAGHEVGLPGERRGGLQVDVGPRTGR